MVENLKNKIDLDNNYYLGIVNDENEIPKYAINIKDSKLTSVLKKTSILLRIDFNNFEKKQYKKILKKLLLIKKMIEKNRIGIREDTKILLGYVINYDKDNKNQSDFILAINAIFYKTRYERYNYIYDTVCDYLDSFFYRKNLCDFKDNKCGEKKETSSFIGCCRHYKYKLLGPFNSKLVNCEHLTKEYKCGAKCISCKLYTCDYLRKKGIVFKIKDILLFF